MYCYEIIGLKCSGAYTWQQFDKHEGLILGVLC